MHESESHQSFALDGNIAGAWTVNNFLITEGGFLYNRYLVECQQCDGAVSIFPFLHPFSKLTTLFLTRGNIPDKMQLDLILYSADLWHGC
jgi:hypothetical protein